MTDPTPNTLSAEFVLTGPALQIMSAMTAIQRLEQDYPGLELRGHLHVEISFDEYRRQKTLDDMTIEELLGYNEDGSPPSGVTSAERARSCLKRAKIETVGQLTKKTEDDILAITNFGQMSLDLVKEKLGALGLGLKPIC